jgi:hypothetical protein
MKMNYKGIISGFLHNLQCIADKQYQKRVWIEGRGPECHSFDEAANDFFDDSEPILENYKDYGLSLYQSRELKKFYVEFREFSDQNYFPEEFIDSPAWDRITQMAKSVLKLLSTVSP